MPYAYLGLGSNMGDCKKALEFALAQLRKHHCIRVVRAAAFLETDPEGYLDQDRFLNTAVHIETTLTPHQLLAAIGQIEQDAGRVRTIRWGPRTLDIDILLYDNLVLDDPDLTIPHPRMRERMFVLLPLAAIAPDLHVPPDGQTVKQLLQRLNQGRCSDAHNDRQL